MATPGSSSPPPPSAVVSTITLHILSPAPEVAGGRITFPSISLDTTISQLKAQLQNSITAAPPPERQRLIYRGRALVDGNLSLKSVFQSELDASNAPSTHTLHLVLPPTASSNTPSSAPSVAATIPTVNQAPPAPPAHQLNHGPHLPHQAIAQAQAAQMILQNQLNHLQQQLAMHNPVHVPTEQIAHMQAQQHARIAQQTVLHQQQQHHTHQPHHHPQTQQEQIRGHGGRQDLRNSNHSADTTPNQSSQTSQGHPPSASMSAGPTTTTVHEAIGPGASRVRVVVNETVNYHISRQGTPVPPGQQPSNIPLQAPPNGVPNLQFLGQTGGSLPPLGIPLPHPNSLMASSRLPSASAHGRLSSSTTPQTASATTTAWLLSTPVGPQALVFAPGHGYFSSAPTPTTAQLTTSNRQHGTRHHGQSSSNQLGHNPGQPNNQTSVPAVNGAPAQAVARPGEPQQGQAINNNNENDIFHFILQRGWLFLRLYIFMFVLSDPGTWRRWFLLAVAVIVCLLPRENPLRDLTNRIRAHIDALIPIAAAPDQRQQGQTAQNGGHAAGQPGPAAGQAAQQPSPEQAAARIMRQNQERQNHGVVRDTIFRIERAMALFLASLIPGVGERHVRAREEARREAQRIENERLAAENARAAEETTKKESGTAPTSVEHHQDYQGEPSASSNGAQMTASAG